MNYKLGISDKFQSIIKTKLNNNKKKNLDKNQLIISKIQNDKERKSKNYVHSHSVVHQGKIEQSMLMYYH